MALLGLMGCIHVTRQMTVVCLRRRSVVSHLRGASPIRKSTPLTQVPPNTQPECHTPSAVLTTSPFSYKCDSTSDKPLGLP